MISTLKQLRHYVRRLGLYRGVETWRRILSASDIVSAPVPGSDSSVLVRTGTSDVFAYEEIIIKKEYDVEMPVKDPLIIIDAGANVGYTSVFMAEKYPGATIVAVEPEDENFKMLLKNTREYDNVKTIKGALWPFKEKVRVENEDDQNWSFRVDRVDGEDRGVDTVTVREIIDEENVNTIDILKIDIEGGEKELFGEGNSDWIARTRSIIIELHDRKRSGCSAAFYRAVCDFDFDQYHKGMNTIWINRSLAEDNG